MIGFVSYSHEDYDAFTAFQAHLKSVERAFSTSFWADQRISGGSLWDERIKSAISAANIFVMLISPDFIASDYIFETEVPAIRDRYQSSNTLILPVVIKRCSWQIIAHALQAIPMHAGRLKPILDWKPQNHGYDAAREQIGIAINNHFGLAISHVDWRPS